MKLTLEYRPLLLQLLALAANGSAGFIRSSSPAPLPQPHLHFLLLRLQRLVLLELIEY